MTDELNEKKCEPCLGGMPVIAPDVAENMMGQLHQDWVLADSGKALVRRLKLKGFNKPVYHANLAAFLGDQEGHHPDICFGWEYCTVKFKTHIVGGLTQNDFICAAKYDRLVAGG